MRKKRRIACLITILLSTMPVVLPMSDVIANANSAPSFWVGVDSAGALILDEECPLEVEKETLVFQIDEFPKSYYDESERVELEEYSAEVTANYTFYNPMNYTVKARLAFPFGEIPSYMQLYNSESGENETVPDLEDSEITLDGVEIPRKIRYSYAPGDFSENIEDELIKLKDTYVEDSFYCPDLQLTKYVYECSALEYSPCTIEFFYQGDPSERRIWFASGNSYQAEDDGTKLNASVKNGELLELYVFGKPLDASPAWTFYRRISMGGAFVNVSTQGEIQLKTQDSITLKSFIFNAYEENLAKAKGVSEVDWYNASIQELLECKVEPNGVIARYDPHLENCLLRWYEYEIEVAPHSRVVNSVTAPIYPTINGGYEPEIYSYTYLLSPAKGWGKFGSLDIEIHTSFYLVEEEIGFTETDFGYAISLQGLPEGELNFSLSEVKNPKRDTNFITGCGYMLIYMFFIPEMLIEEIACGCQSTIGTMLGINLPILAVAVALFFKKRQ